MLDDIEVLKKSEFSKMNGEQLFGLKRLSMNLRMGMHPVVRGFSIKQKLALNYVFKQIKLTRIGSKVYSNTFTPFYPSLAYDRYMEGLSSIISGQSVPIVSNIAITARCPCSCWHCSFSDRSKKDALSLTEIKQTISGLQDLGSSLIGITGGEPLVRKDLEKIIEAIGPRSMPVMFTTGYNLTRERVRSLKDAGLEIPVLSLDHYIPEKHDKGRGVKGIFKSTLKAIEYFKSEGFYTAVSFVPSRELLDEPEEAFQVLDFFKDIGINDIRLTSPILSGKLTCTHEEKLSEQHKAVIFDMQKKCTSEKGYPGSFAYDFFEGKDYYGCGAGYHYAFIDSMGNLCPCDFAMISLGNIKKEPLKDVWERTNQSFCVPGCDCYANVISDSVGKMKNKTWPLDVKRSKEIIKKHPTHDPEKLPEFFRRMGLRVDPKILPTRQTKKK